MAGNKRIALSCFAFVMVLFAIMSASQAQNSPQDYVDAHNSARSDVGVGGVSWDETVLAYAQNYANQRKGDCKLVHSGGQYGENIFWGSSADFSGIDAVNSWVSEKQYYDHSTNSCQSGQVCGHYTQVVWRSSTQIGCARVVCDNNGGVFITCNYNPAGNIVGESPY
jgi:pathogenesis-related protein 1